MRFTAPEVSAAKAKTTVVKDEFEAYYTAEAEPKLANPSPAPSPLDLMYAYFDAA